MSNAAVVQNYGFEVAPQQASDMVQIEQSKVMHEVQAAMIVAKKFPRNESKAFERIMNACKRPFLAEQSVYAYPRGTEIITGPSIRLSEVLAQNWGNITFGIREISQKDGMSIAEAYAWDLETNVQQTKVFHVPHMRHTKSKTYKLTDPRDIYELVANHGARRLRACILGIIPGDISEAAVKECEKTMTDGKEPISERVRKMIVKFGEHGVSVEQLEKRLGHKLEATIEAELVKLTAIYKSIKDGVGTREQFFDFGAGIEHKSVDALNDVFAGTEEKKTKDK